MTYRYPMQAHTAETLQAAVTKAFEAALPVADAQGVGLVVVVIDLAERVHYQTNLGPTMTAGMLSRCAGLYDAKPATPHGVPVALGPITTHGPGGGVAGGTTVATGGNGRTRPMNDEDRASLYRGGIILGAGAVVVTSDPPDLGGEGRPGPSGSELDLDAMNRGRAARGMPELTQAQLDERLASLPAPGDVTVRRPEGDGFIECTGCAQPFTAAEARKLRERGKLFRFYPGTYCPECAERYTRGELDPSSSPPA